MAIKLPAPAQPENPVKERSTGCFVRPHRCKGETLRSVGPRDYRFEALLHTERDAAKTARYQSVSDNDRQPTLLPRR